MSKLIFKGEGLSGFGATVWSKLTGKPFESIGTGLTVDSEGKLNATGGGGADATIYASDHISRGLKSGKTIGGYSIAYGDDLYASGGCSVAFGQETVASGNYSFAAGYDAKAQADYAHAEGNSTKAEGEASHAEGCSTTADGDYSHAEGIGTKAILNASHAEGNGTEAFGAGSHAEGSSTQALDDDAHAEGFYSIAKASASHAEGSCTIASSWCQHVEGTCNVEDNTGTYVHIVGNGEDEDKRSNAYTLDWQGNGVYSGTVKATNIQFTSLGTGLSVDSDGKLNATGGGGASSWDDLEDKPFTSIGAGLTVEDDGELAVMTASAGNQILMFDLTFPSAAGWTDNYSLPTGWTYQTCFILSVNIKDKYSVYWRQGIGLSGNLPTTNNRTFVDLNKDYVRAYTNDTSMFGLKVRVVMMSLTQVITA